MAALLLTRLAPETQSLELMAHTRGRVSGERGAAVVLGVDPNTLRAKMRKLKIKPKDLKKTE